MKYTNKRVGLDWIGLDGDGVYCTVRGKHTIVQYNYYVINDIEY